MSGKQILFYFGHHKCATVWIHSIFKEICDIISLNIGNVHSQKQFNGDIRYFVETNNIDFLSYTNADIDYLKSLTNFRGFHVIRDPRDIAVSSYFSHMNSHPTAGWDALIQHRTKLQSVSKDEGLYLDMEFIHQGVYQRIDNWDYSLENVLEIKMEKLSENPFEQFKAILDFLGLTSKEDMPSDVNRKIILKKLMKIVERKNFSKLSGGRKPGEEDPNHHFRKGVSGDWENHFSEEHIKCFKKKYGDMLIKLGYEKNNNW